MDPRRPERAKDGPFGTTIAHGYLTLSITNMFLPQLLAVPTAKLGINYGANKVRFPAPVPVDSRIRVGCEIVEVDDVAGGVQVVDALTVEVEGGEKPACVVDSDQPLAVLTRRPQLRRRVRHPIQRAPRPAPRGTASRACRATRR